MTSHMDNPPPVEALFAPVARLKAEQGEFLFKGNLIYEKVLTPEEGWRGHSGPAGNLWPYLK